MRRVVRFVCEACHREHDSQKSAEDCEDLCRRIRAERDARIEEEKRWHDAGHDTWPENGELCHAPRVDPALFGSHTYAHDDGTGQCVHWCGCWMGSSRSGGPVNPFGACPSNPRAVAVAEKGGAE